MNEQAPVTAAKERKERQDVRTTRVAGARASDQAASSGSRIREQCAGEEGDEDGEDAVGDHVGLICD